MLLLVSGCACRQDAASLGSRSADMERGDTGQEGGQAGLWDARADTRDAARDPEAEPGDGQADDQGAQTEARSGGCGTNLPGGGTFVARTIQVGDRPRTFHVRVPANYDPHRAYDLVTRWHGRGGHGLSGGLDIQYASGDDAIVVGADGLDQRWSSRDSDLALFDAILEVVGGEYCVNLKRVFAYGFSAGGGFTNLLSCVRAEALRGIAAVAGFASFEADECKGQVAAWYLHDAHDDAVALSQGIAARDRMVQANGCSASTVNVGDDCVAYQGCASGYPVVWCQTSGRGHDIRGDWAPAKVWTFFSGL